MGSLKDHIGIIIGSECKHTKGSSIRFTENYSGMKSRLLPLEKGVRASFEGVDIVCSEKKTSKVCLNMEQNKRSL